MPTTINGITCAVLIEGLAREAPLLVGTRARALTGRQVSSVRRSLRQWTIRSGPLDVLAADGLRAMIEGAHYHWPGTAAADIYTDGGLGPSGGTVTRQTVGKHGVGYLRIAGAGDVTYPTELDPERYILAGWYRAVGATPWLHGLVIQAGGANTRYIDGTPTGGALPFQADVDGQVVIAEDFELSDLVALRAAGSTAWVAEWLAAHGASPWPSEGECLVVADWLDGEAADARRMTGVVTEGEPYIVAGAGETLEVVRALLTEAV